MLTYDIKDLYVNILTKEIPKITNTLLLKYNDARITKQIITFGYHSTTKLFLIQESYIPTRNRNIIGVPKL